MESIRLLEVTNLFGAELPDCEIKSVVTDTRKITKDCLFVALRGEKFDGADFVLEALENGAAAAISEREFAGKPVICVPDARVALGRLAAYYKSKFKLLTVALTGSCGKTTTKEFVSAVLETRFKTLKTSGNFNNDIGLPMTIFEITSEHQACVLEMGMNHAGELSRLTAIAKPDIAVITNIGSAHIENLGSRENIAAAKFEILEGLQADGCAIINADEPLLFGAKALENRRTVTFGLSNSEADFRATNIFELSAETDFVIESEAGQLAVCISTIGRHNVYNALCAATVGFEAGLSEEEIKKGLSKFENTGGRQKIYDMSGIRIIDDSYNANPDSMDAALSVLASFEGRKIAVLGDMLELGDHSEKAHKEVGEKARKICDLVFALGNDACYYIGYGKNQTAPCDARHFDSANALASALCDTVKEGDTILFKGSRGMKMEDVIEMLIKGWKKQ